MTDNQCKYCGFEMNYEAFCIQEGICSSCRIERETWMNQVIGCIGTCHEPSAINDIGEYCFCLHKSSQNSENTQRKT